MYKDEAAFLLIYLVVYVVRATPEYERLCFQFFPKYYALEPLLTASTMVHETQVGKRENHSLLKKLYRTSHNEAAGSLQIHFQVEDMENPATFNTLLCSDFLFFERTAPDNHELERLDPQCLPTFYSWEHFLVALNMGNETKVKDEKNPGVLRVFGVIMNNQELLFLVSEGHYLYLL